MKRLLAGLALAACAAPEPAPEPAAPNDEARAVECGAHPPSAPKPDGCEGRPFAARDSDVTIAVVHPPTSKNGEVDLFAPDNSFCWGEMYESCGGLMFTACGTPVDPVYHALPTPALTMAITSKRAATVTLASTTFVLEAGRHEVTLDLEPLLGQATPGLLEDSLSIALEVRDGDRAAFGVMVLSVSNLTRPLLAKGLQGPLRFPFETTRPGVGGPAVLLAANEVAGVFPRDYGGSLTAIRYVLGIDRLRDQRCYAGTVDPGAPPLAVVLYDRWTGRELGRLSVTGPAPGSPCDVYRTNPLWWNDEIEPWLARTLPPPECGSRGF